MNISSFETHKIRDKMTFAAQYKYEVWFNNCFLSFIISGKGSAIQLWKDNSDQDTGEINGNVETKGHRVIFLLLDNQIVWIN